MASLNVLFIFFTVSMLSIHTEAMTKCGNLKICVIRQTGGDYKVQVKVNVQQAFTGTVTAVKASGFYFPAAAPSSGTMYAPGDAPNLNGPIGKYRDSWIEPIGYGSVQIGFPFVRAFGVDKFCYGSLPTQTMTLSSTGKKKECFKQSMYRQEGVDLALVVDSTGSMWDDIAAVKAQALLIVNQIFLNSDNPRVGIVEYNDPTASVVLPLSSDQTLVQSKIDSLTASGGGDWKEHVYSGLKLALGFNYGMASNRIILTMGDAPPKDPEPGSGCTLSDVVDLANFLATPVDTTPSVRTVGNASRMDSTTTVKVSVTGLNPLEMVPIGESAATIDSFTELAVRTEGAVYLAKSADEVVPAILDAIKSKVPFIPEETKDLEITRICTDSSKLKFRLMNPNSFAVSYLWKVVPGGMGGAGSASSGTSYLYVESGSGISAVTLSFSWEKAETGEYETDVYAALTCEPDGTAEPLSK